VNCPQCNSSLGEGARACAACGWTASRKTLWLVLGISAGVLFLLCCGVGTWFFFTIKKTVERELVPLQLAILRAQVVNYAQKHGKAPASLAEAASEPVSIKRGNSTTQFQTNDEPDLWGTRFRLTVEDGGKFEIRSAGPDGKFDNEDDMVETGALDDDLDAVVRAIEERTQRMGEEIIRPFGIDPAKHRPGSGEVVRPEPPKTEPEPAPEPPPPAGGDGEKK